MKSWFLNTCLTLGLFVYLPASLPASDDLTVHINETGALLEYPIPSGGRAVRHMAYDEARNSLWFGTDTNNLGQAQLP